MGNDGYCPRAFGDGPARGFASQDGAADGDRRAETRRELFDLIRRFRHERYDMRSLLTDGLGMTAAEAHVLAHLLRAEREERGVRPSDVAHRVRITPSAISQTLKALEGKGLIVRERSERDSRSVELRLTAKGKGTASELFRRRATMVDDLIAYIGEDELRAFVSTLGRVMEFCDDRLGHERPESDDGERCEGMAAVCPQTFASENGKAGGTCA